MAQAVAWRSPIRMTPPVKDRTQPVPPTPVPQIQTATAPTSVRPKRALWRKSSRAPHPVLAAARQPTPQNPGGTAAAVGADRKPRRLTIYMPVPQVPKYNGNGTFDYPQESALNFVVIEAPVVRTVKTLRAILQPEPDPGSGFRGEEEPPVLEATSGGSGCAFTGDGPRVLEAPLAIPPPAVAAPRVAPPPGPTGANPAGVPTQVGSRADGRRRVPDSPGTLGAGRRAAARHRPAGNSGAPAGLPALPAHRDNRRHRPRRTAGPCGAHSYDVQRRRHRIPPGQRGTHGANPSRRAVPAVTSSAAEREIHAEPHFG